MRFAEQATLEPDAYFCSRWLASEQERIFARNWQFVGLAGQLEVEGDYLVSEVADRSIAVRRFAANASDDGLRAFANVCSHRHARLLGQDCGNSRLRCLYHGWTYDDEGVPVGLPGNRSDFGLSDEERGALALRRYRLERCGAFLFINLDDQSPSLREHLGLQLSQLLEQLSQTFVRPFEQKTLRWKANWKAALENTLEPYHADFIHGESLAQVLTREFTNDLLDRHSRTTHSLNESSRQWWRKMLKAAKLEPDPVVGDYHHYLIYPNLCLGITNGSLLSIQSFHPAGPDECDLRYRLLLTNRRSESTPLQEVLQNHLSEFNQKVLLEDRAPVESCQLGYRQAARRAVLALNEARVAAFQRFVAQDVSGHTA